MGSHDPWPTHDAAPLPQSIRQRIAQLPERINAAREAPGGRPLLDGFSAMRIYTTFRIALAEHFPEDLGDQGFDLLVDILIYEWLGRRIGTQPNAPFGIGRQAADTPRIKAVRDAGLILLEPDPDQENILTVRLTSGARARLNLFFDYMARYISAL